MVGGAVRQLGGGNVHECVPGRAPGIMMDKAQQILTAVAEAHAAADAALKVAGRAAHIEGDHALVLVPDVHHDGSASRRGLSRVVDWPSSSAQYSASSVRAFSNGCVASGELSQQPGRRVSLRMTPGVSELLGPPGFSPVAEDEDKSPFFAGLQGLHRGRQWPPIGAPAVSAMKSPRLSAQNSLRSCKSPIVQVPMKVIPVGVVARQWGH